MTRWCIYASLKLVFISSTNDWTSHDLLLMWIIGNKIKWNINQNSDIFMGENAFENVVCMISDMLLRSQCVNETECLWYKWHRQVEGLSLVLSLLLYWLHWSNYSKLWSLLCTLHKSLHDLLISMSLLVLTKSISSPVLVWFTKTNIIRIQTFLL